MTNEEKEFITSCDKFKKYTSIKEYIADIQKCLVLSSWHYSDEEAKILVERDNDFIKESFEKKEPANDTAIDIGYCCG